MLLPDVALWLAANDPATSPSRSHRETQRYDTHDAIAHTSLPPMSGEPDSDGRVVAQNRRARHDYFILETFEAGLVLSGTEVKSLRQGKASLAEAFATVENGEAWVLQLHIPPYEKGNRWNLDPVRRRKLLLHHKEIEEIQRGIAQKGQTVVPLRLYFNAGGRAKLLIGLAKGKKTHDKRHAIAERDANREIDRARRSVDR